MKISKAKIAEFLAPLPESYTGFLQEEYESKYEKLLSMDQLHLRLFNMKHSFNADMFVFKKTPNGFFAGIKQISLKSAGKNVFLKSTYGSTISCDGSELKMHSECNYNTATEQLFKLANKKWLFELDTESNKKQNILLSEAITHISVVKDIIEGKAYNFETYYRSIMKNVYKIKVNWKVFRDYLLFHQYNRISIAILKECTDNIEFAMKQIMNDKIGLSAQLLRDLTRQSVVFDRKINFKWSAKRMEEEHQKLTEEIMSLEIEEKEQTPIHEHPVEEQNIHLLNNEMEVFKEGSMMHHCIYTNYYNNINKRTYLGFHMSFPEDCTFGVRRDSEGKPCLDQIYLKYDKSVQESTRNIAIEFIKKNSERLSKLFAESNKANEECAHEELEIMPF